MDILVNTYLSLSGPMLRFTYQGSILNGQGYIFAIIVFSVVYNIIKFFEFEFYVSHSRWCHREDVIKMMSHIFPVRSSWMTDIDIDWENVRKLFDFLKKKKESVGRSVKQLEQFLRSCSNCFSPLLHFRITMTMNKTSLARSRMGSIKRWDWDDMFTFESNSRSIRPWSSSVWHHVNLV